MTKTRPARGVLAKRKPSTKLPKPRKAPTGKRKPPTTMDLLATARAKCRELEGKVKQAVEGAKADEVVALSRQLDEIANALEWPLDQGLYSLETIINAVRAAVCKPRNMLRHMAVFVFGSVVEPFDEDELIMRLRTWCEALRSQHVARAAIEEALKIERDNALHELAELRNQIETNTQFRAAVKPIDFKLPGTNQVHHWPPLPFPSSSVQPDGRATSHHVLPSGRSYSVATGGDRPAQFSKPRVASHDNGTPPAIAQGSLSPPRDELQDDSGPPLAAQDSVDEPRCEEGQCEDLDGSGTCKGCGRWLGNSCFNEKVEMPSAPDFGNSGRWEGTKR